MWARGTSGVAALVLIVLIVLLRLRHRHAHYPKPPFTCTRRYGGTTAPHCLVPLRRRAGLYIAPLSVADATVWCVVDTGSDQLVVAHASCSSCDHTYGVYAGMTGYRSAIRYGTQSDEVSRARDRVAIVGARACGGTPTPVLEYADFRFATTMRREGSRGYNVMGLCDADRDSFIAQVLPTGPFCVFMHASRGFLALGGDVRTATRCAGVRPMGTARLITPPQGLAMSFYVSRLRRVLVNDAPLDRPPSYVLWDTGSNYSSCGPSTLARLRRFGRGTIAFHFYEGGVLRLESTHSNTGTCLIVADEPFESRRLNEDVFVLGSMLLRGLLLCFDRSDRRVSYGKP